MFSRAVVVVLADVLPNEVVCDASYEFIRQQTCKLGRWSIVGVEPYLAVLE